MAADRERANGVWIICYTAPNKRLTKWGTFAWAGSRGSAHGADRHHFLSWTRGLYR